MKNFDFLDRDPLFTDHQEDAFHLPLDWNEELSLEEYLERLEQAKK